MEDGPPTVRMLEPLITLRATHAIGVTRDFVEQWPEQNCEVLNEVQRKATVSSSINLDKKKFKFKIQSSNNLKGLLVCILSCIFIKIPMNSNIVHGFDFKVVSREHGGN